MSTLPPLIDERLRTGPARPWRKVHLDFHNSQYMPSIGEKFDADEFGDRLVEGHVDSIVVFAKDMHGYFYYPTQYEPMHPGLSFDLLGQQVEACRKRKIKVYAYYCVTWDHYLAEKHPEWLVWKRDRTTYLPKFNQTPGWTALCLMNEDLVQLVLNHTRETLESYDLDGIWYDMPLPIGGECFCRKCLDELTRRELDPFDKAVQRRHKQALLVDFLRRAHEQAHAIRPGCQVDQNNQTRLGLGERAPYLDNIDIEALPTAFWGYFYFPANVRYARTFGKSVVGQSGRFHRAWADFGGLKHPQQLRTELAGIIAQGAQCDLGDQMPPNGRLDPAIYQTIGKVYAEIEAIEPYLEKAVPVVEAAIVTRGDPLDDLSSAGDGANPNDKDRFSVYGLTKLLMECHIQFNVIEADADIERYRLLVLADDLQVDTALAERLQRYLDAGGAIIASKDALRNAESGEIWAKALGLTYRGESPFAPAYLKLEPGWAGEKLPDYEYALYEGAAQWEIGKPDVVCAKLGEPLFQRAPAHYTSHAQTPFDHLTNYAAVVQKGRLAATAFPLGASYFRNGYWVYRAVFKRLLQAVLPTPVVETNAPISTEVTLTHQAATAEHPERWLVHLINFVANRRAPEHCEFYEEPIPLHGITVKVNVSDHYLPAHVASTGEVLVMTATSNGAIANIPKIETSAVIVFE